jgi:hypothetical protein
VSYTPRSQPASGLNLVLGGWLAASPWMFGYGAIGTDACNSVVAGALIFATGLSSFRSLGRPVLISVSLLCGFWTLASPWIFGYVDGKPATWNDLLIGLAVEFLALRVAYGHQGRTSHR